MWAFRFNDSFKTCPLVSNPSFMEWKAHKNIIIITKFETEITANKTIGRFFPKATTTLMCRLQPVAIPTAYFEPISDQPDASVKIVKFMWRDTECNLNQCYSSKWQGFTSWLTVFSSCLHNWHIPHFTSWDARSVCCLASKRFTTFRSFIAQLLPFVCTFRARWHQGLTHCVRLPFIDSKVPHLKSAFPRLKTPVSSLKGRWGGCTQLANLHLFLRVCKHHLYSH